MKKCASCSKDLPDAALHCVFCGAKQAPAAQPNVAKTVMGYSSNEVIEQLKAQQAAASGQPVPAPVPYAPPSSFTPTPGPAPYTPPSSFTPTPGPAPYTPPAPAAFAPSPAVSAHGAQAPTMFASGPPPGVQPQPASAPSPVAASNLGMQPTMVPSNNSPMYAPPPAAAPAPYTPQPSSVSAPAPVGHALAPAASPNFLGSTGARAGRPIEPWKDSLRLIMFIFGGVLLAAFCLPLKTDPLIFNWDVIIHGEGSQKIGPLLVGAVGLLSIAFAAIPMTPGPRGMLAAILGLAGGLIPVLIGGMPEWPILSTLVGLIFLIPGLLLRNEYRDASLPRILVTVGAIGALLPFVVPMHGEVGIVALFNALLDAPGAFKVIVGLELGFLAIVVLSLLAWLPAPASGGAKLWAWLIMLWGAVVLFTGLILSGAIGDVVSGSPNTLLSWAAGGLGGGKESMMLLVGLPTAYAALIGYGLATVFGKQLE